MAGLTLMLGALLPSDEADAAKSVRPTPKPPRPEPASQAAGRLRPGDHLPPTMAIVPDAGTGRPYGIVIVNGETVLVVDRETRRVVEVLE